ncbi:hypothetical protein [Pantoea ananatis]|uniref:hypothetical protein n=1 Tax=Pantoea ananas TaxID=553 RepID=UPI001B3073F6|nr:hypothetical protein [Pantoea ananatis]
MTKEVKVEFHVLLTFDVTVGKKSNIYSEVTELLEKNGLTKEIAGNELPENVYFGIRTGIVKYEGDNLTQADIKSRGAVMSKRYYKLLEDYFTAQNVDFKIFISVSRRSTTSVRYTKS